MIKMRLTSALRKFVLATSIASVSVASQVATTGPSAASPAVTSPKASTGPSTSSPHTPGAYASESDLDHALALRAQFGLSTDAGVAARLASGSTADYSKLGIPLTAAETAEIARRDAAMTRASVLGDVLMKTQPGNYSGMWIDQKAGGVIHVAGKNINALAASATTAIPGAVYEQVGFSWSDLEVGQAAATEMLADGSAAGKYIVQAGLEVETNSVKILVDNTAPAAVVADIEQQIPTAIVELTDSQWRPQSRDRTSGPLYGGLWINANSQTGGRCTAGYSNARVGDRLVTLTAGHCSSGPWHQGRFSTSTLIGGTISSGFSIGGRSNCDCKAIGRLPSTKVTSSVLTSDTSTYYYSRTATSYMTGTRVCLSGAAYGDSNGGRIACGTITSPSTSIPYRDGVNFTLTDAVTTDIRGILEGDSGGPYGSDRNFMGLHGASAYVSGSPVATAFSKASNLGTIGVSLRY